ncbi:MAG: hypothetical protein M1269_06070 [Chloroflexi bacterium]|nr:hypothetical protein [Chloroflexota bacterium]
MKKIVVLALVMSLAMAFFAGCTSKPVKNFGLISYSYIFPRWTKSRDMYKEYMKERETFEKEVQLNKGTPSKKLEDRYKELTEKWDSKKEELVKDISKASEKVGQKNNLQVILLKSVPGAYGDVPIVRYGGTDISSEVLDALNSR